eukprot:g25920.t1
MRHLDRQPALSEAAEQEQAVSPLSAYSEVKGMDEEEGEEEEEEDSEQEQREEVIEREAKARAKEGFTARAERDFVRSVEEYDRAIELVTSIGREPDWIWLYHRGSSMGNLKDSEAGGKTYKWNKVLEDGHRVCKLEPELPQGFRLVGIAHYRLSNFSKALQSFLSALEKCPETGKDREKLENFVKVGFLFDVRTEKLQRASCRYRGSCADYKFRVKQEEEAVEEQK